MMAISNKPKMSRPNYGLDTAANHRKSVRWEVFNRDDRARNRMKHETFGNDAITRAFGSDARFLIWLCERFVDYVFKKPHFPYFPKRLFNVCCPQFILNELGKEPNYCISATMAFNVLRTSFARSLSLFTNDGLCVVITSCIGGFPSNLNMRLRLRDQRMASYREGWNPRSISSIAMHEFGFVEYRTHRMPTSWRSPHESCSAGNARRWPVSSCLDKLMRRRPKLQFLPFQGETL